MDLKFDRQPAAFHAGLWGISQTPDTTGHRVAPLGADRNFRFASNKTGGTQMSMLSLIVTHRAVARFPATGFAAFFARIRDNGRAARELEMLGKYEPYMLADIGLDHFTLAHEEIQKELYQAAQRGPRPRAATRRTGS